MKLTTLQWNIGGGKIRTADSDPTNESSYTKEDLPYIADVIKKYSPDIVTLQESHTDDKTSQAEQLSRLTDLQYWVNNAYDHSHLTDGQELSQSVLSKFPISNHEFSFFVNPKYEVVRENGEKWISHDKGVTSCVVELPQGSVEVRTSHMIPFRKFNVDPNTDEVANVRADIQSKLVIRSSHLLVQGDFNYDDPSLRKFLPGLFEQGIQEVETVLPTTPKGRRYDHIMYKGLNFVKFSVDETTLTDHYPVIVEFVFD